ncbi:mycofactocin system transcriptional regulator [Rhodococcus sp. SRB_17]|uniref:mycofactocin system transcriptional regulator n=1 Tax=Rhodococcus sp. OK302 TaxID=1882769 RepID=UPI000B93BB57|nr:mycofactocin system transcriptional regulator [Rhodococcus sp. OK302]NMM84081.1 mycofactocin system transcriptional regulator [Rhodococcus sp. SRB_17]OYD68900.1 TetR family transcriptional regulator [Rhodococcus sp. OK302]
MRSRKNPSARIGRRPSTTREGISKVGIELFSTLGFNDVSVDQIADAAGIARRTFFRYFPSKNAVPWGDFDGHLDQMRQHFDSLPDDIPLVDALESALLTFNTFPPEETAVHRKRMELILTVPTLQAYSVVMYEGWRQVIAEYASQRMNLDPTDHRPRTVGYLLLGVAMAAYEQWLTDDALELPELLRTGTQTLRTGISI